MAEASPGGSPQPLETTPIEMMQIKKRISFMVFLIQLIKGQLRCPSPNRPMDTAADNDLDRLVIKLGVRSEEAGPTAAEPHGLRLSANEDMSKRRVVVRPIRCRRARSRFDSGSEELCRR